jgi:hypothetical protein
MTKKLVVAAPLLVGAALLAFGARSEEVDQRPASKAPPVEVLGQPVNCVDISRIRNPVVHDDYTIDFQLSRGDIYRNTLPSRCSQLGVEKRIAYEASIGRLCAVETISVIQRGAAGGATRCSLGKFVPVRYIEVAGD